MKRDPALAELSREHLPGLILAYRLRHGRSSNPAQPWPADPLDQRREALAFIRADLQRHFAAEELFLIPLSGQVADPGPSERVLDEHRRFWAIVARIEAANGAELPPLLRELGEVLEAHIRFEERIWFEQLQREVPPEQLAELGRRIDQFLAHG